MAFPLTLYIAANQGSTNQIVHVRAHNTPADSPHLADKILRKEIDYEFSYPTVLHN